MAVGRTDNFSVYARRMLLDGLLIHKDFSDVKEVVVHLGRIGNNINQIAKKVNMTDSFLRDDMQLLQKNYQELSEVVNKALLKIIYEDRRR